jgi:hypothetical protein
MVQKSISINKFKLKVSTAFFRKFKKQGFSDQYDQSPWLGSDSIDWLHTTDRMTVFNATRAKYQAYIKKTAHIIRLTFCK